MFSKAGKGFLVMHANSTMCTFLSLSLKCRFLSLFFLLSLSIHYSYFLGYCVVVLSHIHGYYYYLYHNLIHALFPLFLFSPTILSTVDTKLIPTTYWPLSSNRVQMGSILLRSFSLILTTNGLPILSKCQSTAEPPHISFPKMVKASIKSLCPRPLACIRWFPPTHFPFLVKILSQQSIFPKVVSVGYQI